LTLTQENFNPRNGRAPQTCLIIVQHVEIKKVKINRVVKDLKLNVLVKKRNIWMTIGKFPTLKV
jgi:hypothetical protein